MRFVYLFLSLTVSLLLIIGCSSNNSTSPKDTKIGTLKMLLTDAPGEFDEVNITFSEVSVHFAGDTTDVDITEGDEVPPVEKVAGEWIIINDEEQTFNLLELTDGVTALLGENELETGHYTQIRLIIKEAEVVIDTTHYSLTIPSGTLKFVSGFDIEAETPTELIIDFDAARSINTTGKKENYILKPTIRIINNVECGSIIGQVINYEHLPIAYAIADGDTVTSSYVNNNNGRFTLGFLSEGMFAVSLSDTLGQEYIVPNIQVISGSKTNLGEITLE